MESVILKSNSIADIELIITLARKLGIEIFKFNETNKLSISSQSNDTKLRHNFLNSKGLWINRSVDANSLRNEAWKIQN